MWYDVDTNEHYNDAEMLDLIYGYIEDMEYEDFVDETIDDSYSNIEIAGIMFSPSKILKTLEPCVYENIILEKKDSLYREVEYYFDRYDKVDKQKLTDFLDALLSNYFADSYEWREE